MYKQPNPDDSGGDAKNNVKLLNNYIFYLAIYLVNVLFKKVVSHQFTSIILLKD